MDPNPDIEILDENSLFDTYIELLYKCQQLPEEDLRVLCEKAIEVLGVEDNVVKVPAPVTVWGDTHGQFYDLLEIFKLGGAIPETNYLFLGDYVDRGANSVELFSLLLAYKVRYPQRITLLRGGDEGREITQARGFYEEWWNKYQSINAWKYFTEVFDNIPIAAVVHLLYYKY